MHSPISLPPASPRVAVDSDATVLSRYLGVRQFTESLCQPLVTEDFVVQSMPDVSPTKWHLAHTSWFFETFLLLPHLRGYQPFDPHFSYLFNSYYVAMGDRHCRQNRGLLSRPTVEQVFAYRKHVDAHMAELIDRLHEPGLAELRPVVELGLHHEQQHQELMLMDIQHVFWVNPLRPAYHRPLPPSPDLAPPMRWIGFPGGQREIGHAGDSFAFDNESPRHRVYLPPYELANRLVTNGEWNAFMADDGYRRPELWLSAGWATVQQEQWAAPLYWLNLDGVWQRHSLGGVGPIDDAQPVCHISYYEADAFARWAGARLPTEAEWECAAADTVGGDLSPSPGTPGEGWGGGSSADVPSQQKGPQPNPPPAYQGRGQTANFAESARFAPDVAPSTPGLVQMLGDAWEWTGSAYLAYPGYRPPPGALGEYNGKFMCNQFVLRGGCCATPASHIRITYRNFFPPEARWQFAGLRIARDA
ncbi:MAG TPA: ergothioneine biosynthesis protein EgtB [Tepidisphaeraceae bacterium]|jgi:ergothioneine biosynthesis protein EgtB|nr:ergothioneine biosynthesis protein EgtB [Tepidisphaeraceae bacterium]